MKGKKLLSTATALSLCLGLTVPAAFAAPQAGTNQMKAYGSQGTFDLAIANEDRLIGMLKKNGTLSANATPAETQAALQAYLRTKSQSAAAAADNGQLKGKQEKLEKSMQERLESAGLYNGQGNKLGQAKKADVAPAQPEAWNGDVRTDRVLVVLIEYPDFPASQIRPEDTDMYYDEYLKQHYYDMILVKMVTRDRTEKR